MTMLGDLFDLKDTLVLCTILPAEATCQIRHHNRLPNLAN